MNIPAQPVMTFDNGRALWLAAEAGDVPVVHKIQTPEGSHAEERREAFPVGSLMLTGPGGATVFGPVSCDQVLDYARMVLADVPRVRTRSEVALMLAAALLVLDRERNG